MFKYILSISLTILFFTSCSKQPEYTIKHFKNINKDAVLNAAKTVLLLSDKDYNIHSKKNSIDAQKEIAQIKTFGVSIKSNEIKLEAIQEDFITKAKLIITQKSDFDKAAVFVNENSHNLFWDRVDYILGLSDHWPKCITNRIKLNFDGVLCDMVYSSNYIPTSNNIIRNISISQKEDIDDESVALAKIDLSVFDNMSLPLVDIKENNDIVPLEIKGMFDLGEDLISNDKNDTNTSILPIINKENNITIISYLTKIKNNKLIKKPDENITIISFVTTINDDNNLSIKKDTNNTVELKTTKFNSFKDKFMNANPATSYTINLALMLTMDDAKAFIKKHHIEDNTFLIKFNKNKEYIKIMYGVFKNKQEAIDNLNNLSNELKRNKPTIEGVARKQELYKTNDIKKSNTIYLKNNFQKMEEIDLKTEKIKVISE